MATINSIGANDNISDSRSDINTNFANLNSDKIETSTLDTDTSLAANSDLKIATQKAVKAYVDTGGNVNASESQKGIVEIASAAEVAAGTDTGATGAKLVMTPSQIQSQTITYAQADSPATWTKDTGLKRIFVQVWGGGGSGAADFSGIGSYAGGGGGGGYNEMWIEADELGATETVTIGAGAAGVGTTATNGNAGNKSSFGSFLEAYGGGGGSHGNPSGGGGGGGIFGVGGTASGATSGTAGSPGYPWGADGGASPNKAIGGGGGGASSNDNGGNSEKGGAGGGASTAVGGGSSGSGGTSGIGGNGGAGGNEGTDGTAGSVPGGGGGAYAADSTSGNSGAGGDGQVIVTEYYV